ncbi:MAG: DNA polymerase, partial [Candidatus Dojkabacteria bacterium]|nr:DNA polymerase [Candidatus Dojkabacteria bacterium]
EEFSPENPKCIHHDHTSGKFVCALCKKCNIAISEQNLKIRVIFHNFKGYDSHFIIRLAVKTFNISEIDQFIIGTSNQQFSYIQYGNFIFMDSLQHLKASLDELVSRTPKEKFLNFKKLKMPEILLQKGIYPYDWVVNGSCGFGVKSVIFASLLFFLDTI